MSDNMVPRMTVRDFEDRTTLHIALLNSLEGTREHVESAYQELVMLSAQYDLSNRDHPLMDGVYQANLDNLAYWADIACDEAGLLPVVLHG